MGYCSVGLHPLPCTSLHTIKVWRIRIEVECRLVVCVEESVEVEVFENIWVVERAEIQVEALIL